MKYTETKFIILLLCCSFSAQNIIAQQNLSLLAAFNNYTIPSKQNDAAILFLARKVVPKTVIGNPYLFDWQNGLLVSKDNKIFSIGAKYSFYTDEFRIRYDDEERTIYPTAIKAIAIKNHLYLSCKYRDDDALLSNAFFELLEDGEKQLLIRYIPVVKEKHNGIEIQGMKPQLYFKKQSWEIAVEIKSIKKDLSKIFEEYYDVALNIIHTNELDPNNLNDLQQLFKLFNETIYAQRTKRYDY